MFRGTVRTIVVTGSASGIGAATARYLRNKGVRVIGSDLHKADVVADLTTAKGRAALVDGVTRLSGGKIDAIVANAGGGPPETMVQLNYFGAVATLEGLRPLLKDSKAPRAVAVSSIGAMRPPRMEIVEACLKGDEPAAVAAAREAMRSGAQTPGDPLPAEVQTPLILYGSSKFALQRWCRREAVKANWAGAGIALNVVPLGFYDTPAAAYVLNNPEAKAAMARMFPLKGSFPGRAEEAAAVLAFLVSEENTQITGQILFADAGFECAQRGQA